MAARLILVRHGSTELNAGGGDGKEDRIRGHLNVPLSSKGRTEAVQVALVLAKKFPDDIDVIYTSPLERAVDTAEEIADTLSNHPKIVKEESLWPWDVGVYAGKPTQKVLPELTRLVETPDEAPEGGEPFVDWESRYLKFLQKQAKEAIANDETRLFVTHTRNVRATQGWVKEGRGGLDPEQMLGKYDVVDPAGIIVMTPISGERWNFRPIYGKGGKAGQVSGGLEKTSGFGLVIVLEDWS